MQDTRIHFPFKIGCEILPPPPPKLKKSFLDTVATDRSRTLFYTIPLSWLRDLTSTASKVKEEGQGGRHSQEEDDSHASHHP